MPTLRAGDREFHTLAAGQVLTVVAAAASAGIVRQYPASGFNATSSQPVPAGATVTVGPFTGSVRLGVECAVGQVDWSAGLPSTFPAPALSDPQAAAAQALVSAAGIAGNVSKLQKALDAAFGTVSFSRASANASVVDCFGSMQFCTSGEARFYGARRVENTIPDTESLNTGWALGTAPTSTKTAVSNKSPNHGRPSAWRIDRPSGNSNMLVLSSRSYRPGKWCFSAWVIGDGTTQITVRIERSGDSVGTGQTVTPAAGAWVRIAVTHDVVDASNHRAWISVTGTGAASFTMCDPQMEWVHGQASPAPSDYVPRGVPTTLLPASAYANEAGVDGVRYYDYFNPWTLSSGIAARGTTLTYIDPSTLKGVAVAGASATNQVWSSGNVSAAEWTKSSTVNATPADSTLLGKNSLWKIEQAAATQGHRVSQSWRGAAPAVNVPMSATVWAKAGDAACPFIYIAVRQLDGTTFKYAYFNLQTGVVGNVTSGAEAFMFKEGDLWCCNIILQSGASGSTAPSFWIGVTQTNGNDGVAGTLGNGNWIGGTQIDAGLPTSYIGDTSSSASLTRAAETLTAVSSNMPTVDWTVAADIACRLPTASALKPTWLYLLYSHTTQSDRGGFGLRPAAFGGFYDGGEDEIFFDWYPNVAPFDNTTWDGIHIKPGVSPNVVLAVAMETWRYQWSAATTAVQPSGGNQSAAVGAVLASSVGNDQPRPAVNTWPSLPRTWTVGRQNTSTAQRGEVYCANLTWWSYARTAAQMQAAA